MRKAAIAGIAIAVVVGMIFGLVAYSYTQIHVSFTNASLNSIDWNVSASSIVKGILNAITGNWLAAAFDVIDGIKVNLFFDLTNGGFLPVYIPNLTYDLLINGIWMGEGSVQIDETIMPGQTKQIVALQDFKKQGLAPAVSSIIENGGEFEIRAKGTAHFSLFGLDIPVPFESSRTISIVDEIKNKLSSQKPVDVKTAISLNVPGHFLQEGTTATISGRLTTENGQALGYATVYIKDDDPLSSDDIIATRTTDNNGYFSYKWNVKKTDTFDSSVEMYASFEGAQGYSSARSSTYDITVQKQTTSSSQTTQSPTQSSKQTSSKTSISLSIPYTSVNKGDILQISGRLVDANGNGLYGARIDIKDEDTGSGDDLIASVTTDSSGRYSYNWSAKSMDFLDSTVEIYAVFEGTSSYDSARSVQINVHVG